MKYKFLENEEELDEVKVVSAEEPIADGQLRAYLFCHAPSHWEPDVYPEAMIFIASDLDSAKRSYLEYTVDEDERDYGYIGVYSYLRMIVEKPLNEGLFYESKDLVSAIDEWRSQRD